jgi:hypothetical protein
MFPLRTTAIRCSGDAVDRGLKGRKSSAFVAKGVVYVGAEDFKVHALNASWIRNSHEETGSPEDILRHS